MSVAQRKSAMIPPASKEATAGLADTNTPTGGTSGATAMMMAVHRVFDCHAGFEPMTFLQRSDFGERRVELFTSFEVHAAEPDQIDDHQGV